MGDAPATASRLELLMPATKTLGSFVDYILERLPDEVLIGLPRLFKLRNLVVRSFEACGVGTVDELADAFVGTQTSFSRDLRSALRDAVPSDAFNDAFFRHLLELLLYTRKWRTKVAKWDLMNKKRGQDAKVGWEAEAASRNESDATEAKSMEPDGVAAAEQARNSRRSHGRSADSRANRVATRRLNRSSERRASKASSRTDADLVKAAHGPNMTFDPTVRSDLMPTTYYPWRYYTRRVLPGRLEGTPARRCASKTKERTRRRNLVRTSSCAPLSTRGSGN